jgi:hypothetical protein
MGQGQRHRSPIFPDYHWQRAALGLGLQGIGLGIPPGVALSAQCGCTCCGSVPYLSWAWSSYLSLDVLVLREEKMRNAWVKLCMSLTSSALAPGSNRSFLGTF